MAASYELHDEPELESPVLLLASRAGSTPASPRSTSAGAVLGRLDTEPGRHVRRRRAARPPRPPPDHAPRRRRQHRPQLAGHRAAAGDDASGNDLLVLVGRRARSLLAGVHPRGGRPRACASAPGMVVGLGAYPAAVPHTRPTVCRSPRAPPSWPRRWPFLRGTLDVPAGRAGGHRARLRRRRPSRDRPLGAGAPLHLGDALPRGQPGDPPGHWPTSPPRPARRHTRRGGRGGPQPARPIIAGNAEHAAWSPRSSGRPTRPGHHGHPVRRRPRR